MIPSVKIPARRTLVRLFIALISIVANCPSQQASRGPQLASQQPPPYWAFTVDPPNAPPEATGNTPQHVPNSSQSYTLAQIADLFSVPDWHPESHPPMPDIVARGQAQPVRLRLLSPAERPGTSGKRQSHRSSSRLPHAANGGLQIWGTQDLRTRTPAGETHGWCGATCRR